ncbi:hypothetical protein ACF3M2_12405 [Tissierella carlieri]|uniref:hypothetical protein n=1 Tax=Tissierella carlieri TaxID=689904 RepID=UPI00386AD9B6
MKVRRFLSLALFGVILLGLVVPSMTFAESQINFVDRVELISSEDISEDEMKARESQKININLTEENVIDRVELISSEDISEDEMKERENQKMNISLTEANVIEPAGTTPPNKIWDLTEDGIYKFSGYAERSSLYTEYILKSNGEGFEIVVSNFHSEELAVKVRNRSAFGQTITTLRIPSGKKNTYNVSTNKNIDLQFSIPCDTSGTVDSL